MTPLATEADNLRRWEAEARLDMEDTEKSSDELSERAQRDEEEAARVWKEWDEPPLRWVSPWEPSSELFTLDDAAEGMEWEKLSEGFTATLEALN